MMTGGRLRWPDMEVVRSYMELGIAPVTFGDVVLDDQMGFGICSGDQIMEMLAAAFRPKRIIFVSDVDGLFDSDPKENPDARLIGLVEEESLGSISCGMSVKDVTGGLRGKMEAMLRLCSAGRECVLLNGLAEGRLLSALRGEEITCTLARRD